MLVVETIARIRRDHLVRSVPIKKIARDLRVTKRLISERSPSLRWRMASSPLFDAQPTLRTAEQ